MRMGTRKEREMWEAEGQACAPTPIRYVWKTSSLLSSLGARWTILACKRHGQGRITISDSSHSTEISTIMMMD
jgi:hypothetical protein